MIKTVETQGRHVSTLDFSYIHVSLENFYFLSVQKEEVSHKNILTTRFYKDIIPSRLSDRRTGFRIMRIMSSGTRDVVTRRCATSRMNRG